jgi:tRNA threonylcarbamoyladenosine biosynthesis protein TsaE
VQTDRLGRLLAEMLPSGTTVALVGTLGSGKTRLVRAVAAACGVDADEVVSPTFVLCQEYHGTRDLYHLDAYRLHDEDEFEQLGPDEYFESEGLTFVEWADRVRVCLPRSYLEIQLEVVGETARRFTLHAHGKALADWLTRLAGAARQDEAAEE